MKLNKIISDFDYILFLSTIILTVIGVFFIYSANINTPSQQSAFLKQIIFAISSMVLLVFILMLNPRDIKDFSLFFYIAMVLGVIITLVFGKYTKGQRRFVLPFIGLSLQFSEFLKIATILVLAKYYNNNQKSIRDLKTFLFGALITFIPVGFILLLPDLGSALVFIPIFIGVSFFAGVKLRYILYTVGFIFSVAFIPVITTFNNLFYNGENELVYLLVNSRYIFIVFLFFAATGIISFLAYLGYIKGLSERFRTFFYWYMFFISFIGIGVLFSFPANKILKPYQKDRLLIFFNPYSDPRGKGYNIIQSINTIGNGGLQGKGWTDGDMSQNSFLPEQATDFIFPVIAEESGFFGSLLIMFLYFIIFYRAFLIILNAKDLWSSYVVIGLLSMILFHILENIGMCIGIMPITGIPLPFLSYGGSFLITAFISIALILNISLNKYQY